MGCASSSPIMNGPAGLAGKAKNAVGDIVQQGEDTLHDVGETLNGTIGHVKNAVVGAVQGIGQSIDNTVHNATESTEEKLKNVLGDDQEESKDYTHIPLKDPVSDGMMENMEEFKEILEKKTENAMDETDKMADELIKETNDVVDDIENNLENVKGEVKETNKTPTHSIDSLKTNSPEPEIENALSNDLSKSPPSPKATLTELANMEPNIPPVASQQQADAADTTNNNNNNKLRTNNYLSNKSYNDADFKFNITDTDEFDINIRSPNFLIKSEPTHWEKLADAILTKPVVRFEPNNNPCIVSINTTNNNINNSSSSPRNGEILD